MTRPEFKSFNGPYHPGSIVNFIDRTTRPEVKYREQLNQDRIKQNSILIGEIADKLKNVLSQENRSPIGLTIYEKNPTPKQPDLEVIFTPIKIADQNIFYTRNDKPEKPQSLNCRAFCILTKLTIRDENEFLKENTDITSKFW